MGSMISGAGWLNVAMPIEPDLKDWTWVITKPCPDCGFDGPGLDLADLPGAIRDNAMAWEQALAGSDVAVRPADNVWSTLEYACHVRDVHRLFDERLHLMLDQDDPRFANWDQDATAVEQDYGAQDPVVVARDLVAAAAVVATTYAGVTDDQWDRPGRRSNGDLFTVETMGRYHLHDVAHHLHDVTREG
jgi:hypothetical protein